MNQFQNLCQGWSIADVSDSTFHSLCDATPLVLGGWALLPEYAQTPHWQNSFEQGVQRPASNKEDPWLCPTKVAKQQLDEKDYQYVAMEKHHLYTQGFTDEELKNLHKA